MDPDDVEDMSAERFFSLTERLVAYRGAIRMRAEDDKRSSSGHHESAPNSASSASAKSATTAPAQEKTYYRDIHHNPELAVYFEKGVG